MQGFGIRKISTLKRFAFSHDLSENVNVLMIKKKNLAWQHKPNAAKI
jgi:hypothetical protein